MQEVQFQSTLPARGATGSLTRLTRAGTISIHAPRTGSDRSCPLCVMPYGISIHAPRTGSDSCRVRRCAVSQRFQSTLPARGATTLNQLVADNGTISIHAPRTGSDRRSASICPLRTYFNPRSPHGERPRFRLLIPDGYAISIHAPRTGSDHLFSSYGASGRGFQSTLPARGATYRQLKTIYQQRDFNPRSPHGERPTPAIIAPAAEDISIHAPRTGSDVKDMQTCSTTLHFNPRSPHGERHLLHGVERLGAYFNPRSPHGERRLTDVTMGGCGISIHAPRTGSDKPNPDFPHGN